MASIHPILQLRKLRPWWVNLLKVSKIKGGCLKLSISRHLFLFPGRCQFGTKFRAVQAWCKPGASLVQTMRPGDRLGKVPTIASAVWRGAPNTTPVGYALATVTSSKLQSLLMDLGECVSGLAPVT